MHDADHIYHTQKLKFQASIMLAFRNFKNLIDRPSLKNMAQEYIDHMLPACNEADPGVLPIDDVYNGRSYMYSKELCLFSMFARLLKEFWSYVITHETMYRDSTDMWLLKLKDLLPEYENAKICGDIREGFYLEVPE